MDIRHLSCGIKRQPSGYHFETRAYDQFQVIVPRTGAVLLVVQNVVTTLAAGSLCLLPVGAAFRLACPPGGDGYTGIFAILHGETSAPYRGAARGCACPPEAQQLATMLETEVRHPGGPPDGLLEHLGRALTDYGARLLRENTEAPDAPAAWVAQACRCIAGTIYGGQSLEASLAGLPLSYRQLSRHFQAALGLTPKQYQLRCRLDEARRLLATTRLPITAIALDLGFASSQHFSSQFARAMGCPPTVWRRRASAHIP